MLRLLLGVILLGGGYGCQVGAAGVIHGEAGSALTQSVRYFDGLRWREAWVSEREVVEFYQPGQARTAGSAAPGATLLVEGGGVRIWRLSQPSAGGAAMSRALAPSSMVSPVFHLSSLGGSRLALSGNIVVRFKSEWSEAQIQKWIATQTLTQIKRLNGIKPTYVLGVGGGLEALARANAIHESGEVVYAMPEWWRELKKR